MCKTAWTVLVLVVLGKSRADLESHSPSEDVEVNLRQTPEGKHISPSTSVFMLYQLQLTAPSLNVFHAISYAWLEKKKKNIKVVI